MKAVSPALRSLVALWISLFLVGSCAQAQSGKGEFQPRVGQEGKDVIWVPTPQSLVDDMLDIAKVTSRDYVIDLGSGDGRTVIAAAKRGARAQGIEYNPDMVALSQRNAVKEGVSERASFIQADLFESDFSKATVITMFLLPDINLKLRPKILDLKPGTRVVSNTFTMGEWAADNTVTSKENCIAYCTAYLWIVPARVAGTWQLGDGTLNLTQAFQNVSGSLRRGNNTIPLANGKLHGDQILFNANGVLYAGRVSGDSMAGTLSTGGNWKASRTAQ